MSSQLSSQSSSQASPPMAEAPAETPAETPVDTPVEASAHQSSEPLTEPYVDPTCPPPSESYQPFAVTVDLVVLTIRTNALRVLTICRGEEPYKGQLALPGGFVQPDEDLADAAARELAEETGIDLAAVHLEQLATYGTPGRDPRMRVVTVVYLALVPEPPRPSAGTDTEAADWVPVTELSGDQLAFDHSRILADGLERARSKLEYSPLATVFCPPEFAVGELRRVYEIVWGCTLDPRNFHRKVTSTPGFLEPVGRTVSRYERGRPAQLYRCGTASQLHPPMLRGSVNSAGTT